MDISLRLVRLSLPPTNGSPAQFSDPFRDGTDFLDSCVKGFTLSYDAAKKIAAL
jgi:hypothetical protein